MTNITWMRPTGDALTAAVRERSIAYEGGATQYFRADGTTSYIDAGRPTEGGWRIEGERFCSVWPPATHWDCYDLEVSTDGQWMRFIAPGGTFTGRYTDDKSTEHQI